MAKISNKEAYVEQVEVNKKDYLIGTDYYDFKRTKTFPISKLAPILLETLVDEGLLEGAIIAELQPQYHHFANETVVTINHGLGKIPRVDVQIGVEIVLANVEHSEDRNTVIIRFTKPQSGVVTIQ